MYDCTGLNVFLGFIFMNTLSLEFFVDVRHHISRCYEISRNIVLYIF